MKTATIRLPIMAYKQAGELQAAMNLTIKTAAIGESLKITRRLFKILKNDCYIYFRDADCNEHLLIGL